MVENLPAFADLHLHEERQMQVGIGHAGSEITLHHNGNVPEKEITLNPHL